MMKKAKKILLAALLAACMASGLCGCGREKAAAEDTVRVGSMKGPTSMGLLFLMEKAERGETEEAYEFQMTASADELLPLLAKGELDIALVPANTASVLYHRTEGEVSVIDINTLGVLNLVSGRDLWANGLDGMEELRGKTIYLTGKGTTPDYVLQYLLRENGIDREEYTLEYKAEAAEVAAVLAKDQEAVGLLPQPFAAAACMQNEKLRTVLDLSAEWERIQSDSGSSLVTGVTLVRNEFLEQNEEAVLTFLKEHAESAEAVNQYPEEGARLCVEAGIAAKEELAQEAIPKCSITCIKGEQMKRALSGYLKVLFEYSPESVGGELPGEDFYYRGEAAGG